MTSGKKKRLTKVILALLVGTAQASDAGVDALLAGLARPSAGKTSFVEVRYSALLTEPLLVSGTLEYRPDGGMVRRVTDPYLEMTTLLGDQVLVERPGSRPRRFSLGRAPEMRGMLAGFGAILSGDRTLLDRNFHATAQGDDALWRIDLKPVDAALGKRLQVVTVEGAGDRVRCFTVHEVDGDASVMVLGVAGRSALPASIERDSLAAWCGGDARR